MTENATNPRQNNEVATGCLRYVFALLVMGVFSFAAALTRGFVVLLLPLVAAVWKLHQRWPKMRPPLVFAFGLLGVLVVAGELIIQLEIYHLDTRPLAIGILIVALSLILVLFRWALRRSAALEVTATRPEPPDGAEPR